VVFKFPLSTSGIPLLQRDFRSSGILVVYIDFHTALPKTEGSQFFHPYTRNSMEELCPVIYL
jgi:hypothetical protein